MGEDAVVHFSNYFMRAARQWASGRPNLATKRNNKFDPDEKNAKVLAHLGEGAVRRRFLDYCSHIVHLHGVIISEDVGARCSQ